VVAVGRVEHAVLEALFTQSPIGIHILDPDLRVLRVNTAATGLAGTTAEQFVGQHVRDAYNLSDPVAAQALARRVLITGEPALNELLGAYPPSDPEREHLYTVSVFRLEDPGDQVLGSAMTSVDVTDQERARSRTRVLDAGREQVGRTLETETTCAELVGVVVPAFADAAEVDLLDSVLRGEDPPPAPIGPDVPLRRTAFASAVDKLQSSPSVDTGLVHVPDAWRQCLTDLQPYRTPHDRGGTRPRSGASPPRPGLPFGVHSAIVVPLTLRGGVLGTLAIYRTTGRETFDQDDVDLALALAARASLCLDNARRYTREHTIALTLQRHLLPEHPPDRAAVASARFHSPAGVGGGWFDIIPLSGARVALTVGHVAGCGLHSTAAMGQLRTAIHTLSALDLDPDELLARLDDTVARLAAERAALSPDDPLHSEALTADCLYIVYDPLTLSCTIASAGHPPPVIAHPDATTEIPDLPAAPCLGGDDTTPFAASRLNLPEGSTLALHTDAFLPAAAPDFEARKERLRQILADTRSPLDDLCDEAVRTVAPSPPATDAILLLVRTSTLGHDQVATWDLPPVPAAVATARSRARNQLAHWHLDDLSDATELIVSELTTNAVRYGTPPLTLRLINEHTLTCEVTDASPVAPHLRHARTSDEGGRGLFICAELAQRWGARYTPDGKTIWTEQDPP
jgi:PAS domain S-box-containing protein